MSNLTAIDLFAGAGGLSSGLINAGYKVVFANEVEDIFAKTLKINHPDTEVAVGDIRDINSNIVRSNLGFDKGDLDLLVGGPPCQGFSINAPARNSEDKRNHLFLEYLKFVDEFRPKVAVIENVPGMISFEKGETVNNIIQALTDLGYDVCVKILYMPHYGVPQMRWRTIFIATTENIDVEDLFPKPSHFSLGRANFTTKLQGKSLIANFDVVKSIAEHPTHVTVQETISDLPPIENGGGDGQQDYISSPNGQYQEYLRENNKKIKNHICAGLGSINLERLKHIPAGGSWRDIPYDLLPQGMKKARRSDHTKRYGRLHPDGISSTILTKCDPHWGSYIHPYQDRIISVREAARFQSFQDSYVFFGKLSEQYKQVGNAVPPLFAQKLGEAIAFKLNYKNHSIKKPLPGQQLSLAM